MLSMIKKKLVRNPEKKKIKWHSQVEKNCLTNIIKNENAITLLLNFLKAINMKSKKKIKEKKIK